MSGSTFLLFKLVLVLFGTDDLELFAVIKRYQAFLLPLILMGCGVTIPKYIARNEFGSGLFWFSLSSCFVLYFLGLFLSVFLDELLRLAMLLLLPSLVAGYFYSISRGRGEFHRGAFINISLLSVFSFVCMAFSSGVEGYIYLLFFVSLFFLLFYVFKENCLGWVEGQSITKKNFFFQGVSRVPGDFFNQGLFLLPVFFLVSGDERSMAAQLSLALSVVAASAIPLKPVSTILLVRVSRSLSLSHPIEFPLGRYMLGSFLVMLLFLLFSPFVNAFYFNSDEFMSVLLGLSPLAFFNCLYILSRSYVESFYNLPVLSFLNALAFILAGALSWFGVLEGEALLGFTFGALAITTAFLAKVRHNA